MRHLATIQTISEIKSIVNSDKLDVASILGWKCVVGRNEFKKGDRIVYIEIDSVLPEWNEFEFLRKSCFIDNGIVKGFRIKTIKLRGQYSQGLVLPLSILENKKYKLDTRENPIYEWKDNQDVTPLLDIVQFQKPIPTYMSGKVKGDFPNFIPKSDETRIQVLQDLLKEYEGTSCYVTEKIDGSSATYYFKDDLFGVCSRNLELAQDDVSYHEKQKFVKRIDGKYQLVDEKGELYGDIMDVPPELPKVSENIYWKIARKYDIENRLKLLGRNIALQGEIYGNGLQGNPLKLSEQKLAIFNIYDISKSRYLDYNEMAIILKKLNKINIYDTNNNEYIDLELVPLVNRDFILVADIDYLVQYATKNSTINTKCKQEGIVIRPINDIYNTNYSEVCKASRISFKVISPDYLVKNGE